jgi:hypothetical protein
LSGRLAAWASASKDIPVWPCLANIHKALSLLVAESTPRGPVRFPRPYLARPTHTFALQAVAD